MEVIRALEYCCRSRQHHQDSEQSEQVIELYVIHYAHNASSIYNTKRESLLTLLQSGHMYNGQHLVYP
jgi:hypothetical protein